MQASPSLKRRPLARVVAIGLGNILMSDEGIGVRLVRALAARPGQLAAVDFLDLGCGGLAIIHALRGRQSAVIVDCANMNAPPGSIRRFVPDQAISMKNNPGFSQHEGDLLDILSLTRQLADPPVNVIIYGIQPASLELADKLSTVLAGRFDEYLQLIKEELLRLTAIAAGPAPRS